ncbi:MBL fold metallo-hydrolase [Candidatus Uhrbacteria bacterium]|jgi:metallo-beta-lactamase family protein|nr:MBL fold metallo-hydrolase [Candidatus Uhrbacteria bacterium]
MKLSFHGGVRGVTGSCFLLEFKESKILVDCGMFQGQRMVSNKNLIDVGFNAKDIDAGIITHAHYDHIGRYPLIVKQGFRGTIYTTPPTKALASIVLEDAQHVMSENARRNGDIILFSPDDVKRTESQMKGIGYHTQFEIVPGVNVMFHDAGHILGSAYVTIDVPGSETEDGKPKRLLFSGDIGNEEVPILPDTEPILKADIVVCETTYGNRDHEPVPQRNKELVKMVSSIINRGGTLLIPAFSIERTQELLYELDLLADEGVLPKVPVYLDSPLAIKATEIYRHFKHYLRFDRPIHSSSDHDFFTFPRLVETLRMDASKKINSDRGPKIIIAGSGMMTGGRILHHLIRYLSDKKSGVLIIGYQAEGTLGRQIKDGAKKVKIHQKDIDVNATIKAIGSFSAHGDRNKLRSWLKPKEGKIDQVFLVHGDEKVKPEFKEFIEKEIDSEVIIPMFSQEFVF